MPQHSYNRDKDEPTSPLRRTPPPLDEEPPWPDEEKERMRAALLGHEVQVLPNDMGIKFDWAHRPDGPAMRTLRAICYVMVIITCIGILFALYDAYSVMASIREAAQSWMDGITSPGPVGH